MPGAGSDNPLVETEPFGKQLGTQSVGHALDGIDLQTQREAIESAGRRGAGSAGILRAPLEGTEAGAHLRRSGADHVHPGGTRAVPSVGRRRPASAAAALDRWRRHHAPPAGPTVTVPLAVPLPGSICTCARRVSREPFESRTVADARALKGWGGPLDRPFGVVPALRYRHTEAGRLKCSMAMQAVFAAVHTLER